MNEIKNIHLDRQAFTIAVDAHKVLQEYLHDIEKQVGKNSDVLKEIELRMAELLHERGLSRGKVILPEDVSFLKEQLGAPHDFKEDDGEPNRDHAEADNQAPKRLYRDPEHGMIAGVAAGLAAYFKIDPVIVRLLFVVLTFSGGAGILFYILLWILVPEARTSSERLQMRGKAVTVESLKQTVGRTVEQADIPGATRRAGGVIRKIVTVVGQLLLAVIGAVLTTVAVVMFMGAVVVGTYVLIHGVTMGDEVFFPIGTQAVLGVVSAMLTLALLAFILLTVGIATFKRKWTMPGWIMATTLGLFFIVASVGTAIGFDIAPQFRDKYRQFQQVQTQQVELFNKVSLAGKETTFRFQPDDDYAVEVKYFGKKELLQSVTKQVENGTLTVDTTNYHGESRGCLFCIHPDGGLEVIIHAPTLTDIQVTGDEDTTFSSNTAFDQPQLNLTVDNSVTIGINQVHVDKLTLDASQNDATSNGLLKFMLSGIQSARSESRAFGISYGGVHIYRVGALDITTGNRVCDEDEAFIWSETALAPVPTKLNGTTIASAEALKGLQTEPKSAFNCLSIY